MFLEHVINVEYGVNCHIFTHTQLYLKLNNLFVQ